MYKYHVKYENFNGEEVEKDLWFNLTKFELNKLNLFAKGGKGYAEYIKKISEAKDIETMVSLIETLIASAYGIPDEVGEEFIKSEEITKRFMCSAAYDQFMLDLFTKEDGADAIKKLFIGMVPKSYATEMLKNLEKIESENK